MIKFVQEWRVIYTVCGAVKKEDQPYKFGVP